MNLNNISQIRYGGKDIVLGKINGNVIYDKSIGPEQPEDSTESYYIEYTVASSTKKLNDGVYVNDVIKECKYGLPRIYSSTTDYTYTYDKVEITLTDGTTTDNLNTVCSNVSKIKLWYPKDTKGLIFRGSSTCKPLVKTVDYIKTDNFTNMSYMFHYCSSLTPLDLSNFDTSNVTNMSYMFSNCSLLTSLDLSNFDTSKVTDMCGMFDGCSKLTPLDLSNFDTSNVTNMSYMFSNCKKLTSLDLSNFDTSKVTIMRSMFEKTTGIVNISNFTFSTGSVQMFNDSKITDIIAHNTTCIDETLQGIFFNGTYIKTIDLTGSDFSNVTSFYGLFWNCHNLTTIVGLNDIFHNNLKNISNIFSGCSRLSISLNMEYIMTNVTNASGAFNGVNYLKLEQKNVYPNLEDGSYMFANAKITSNDNAYLFQFPKLKNMSHMFDGIYTGYKEIIIHGPFNLVEDASYAFANAGGNYINASSGAVGVANYTTFSFPNCYNFDYVCYNNSNAVKIDVQGSCQGAFENTSYVDFSCIGPITNANSMFKGCQNVPYELRSLDMSQCYDMSYMFAECYNLQELDISNWNVTSCTTTNSMFYECTSLYSLNLRDWETYNIYDYYDMFYNVPDSCTITVRNNYFTLNESDTGFNGTFNWEW